ncbi:carbohydrate ABC transporter permease [Paenibacillus qinlingensis]|uniref:Aldouronate transport system permease protein n=1 Tax=Paenibacillus qinlingensis TaxID=1837343 RepID=A0ABU1P3D6_9BACL|nr:carbohydrate ABC transporter permease [Paenibacillus qinlingensis]MDR6554253.1 putative aldouronate transport system permease protein [Paenibacillus qinlingensis]
MRSKSLTRQDIPFQIANGLFLLLLVATMILPIWNTFIISISSNISSMHAGLQLWPSELSMEGYRTVWQRVELWRPFGMNVLVTVLGSFAHVLLCAMAGYVLLHKGLPGRKLLTSFILLTMMVPNEAVMIPLYVVNKELGLLNTVSALVLYGLISGFSILLMRNFFGAVSYEMAESAKIDGAGEFRIFATMYVPLAKPGLATITLFEFVSRWNQLTPGLLYITNQKLYTLQVALRALVIQSDATSSNLFMTPNVRMAGVMLALIPLVAIYPFVQKYFVTGLMVGATKE